MFDPILDSNGVEVPRSWREAKERGALTFFAEEACSDCGTSRRFYVEGLRCYGCTTPPEPQWGEVAPDLTVAQARGFRLYRAEPACTEHPTSPFLTATERCDTCQREQLLAELAEQRKQREAALQAEQEEIKRLVKAENSLWRAERAEAKKAEQAMQIITRTVSGPKRKTLARAVALDAALTPQPQTEEACDYQSE